MFIGPLPALSQDCRGTAHSARPLAPAARQPTPRSMQSSLLELLEWPDRVLEDVRHKAKPDDLERLIGRFEQGLRLSSAYSGIDAPALACCFLEECFQRQNLISDGKHIFLDEACEIKPTAQIVLCNAGPPHRNAHVFHDINLFLTHEVLDKLDSITENYGSDESERRDSFRKMQEVLLEAGEAAFSGKARAECVLHEDSCSTRRHDHIVSERPRPHIHFAGTVCRDFSRVNQNRMGFFGPSGRPLLVWMARRRYCKEDAVIQECVRDFDIGIFHAWLSDLYDIDVILVDPTELGWPVTRHRKFCILRLKEGKFAHMTGDWLDFLEIFGKTTLPEEGGDIFFAEPMTNVESCMQQIAQGMAMAPDNNDGAADEPSSSSRTRLSDVASSGAVVRRELYIREFLSRELSIPKSELETMERNVCHALAKNAKRTCIVDLEHNPGFAKLPKTTNLPCLLSHGLLWSMKQGRIMLGNESFLPQGISLQGLGRYKPQWGQQILGMTERQKKDLSGNSINLHVIGAIITYMLMKGISNHDVEIEPSDLPSSSPQVFLPPQRSCKRARSQ